MVKKIIGVGATANDGTGDLLRDAFVKVNDNFTELYNNWTNLNLPEAITDLGISDGSPGQFLTTDGGAGFSFTDITLTDIGITDGTANQFLKTDGSGNFAFAGVTFANLGIPAGEDGQVLTADGLGGVAFEALPNGGGGASTLDGLTDVSITSPANGQVLSYNAGTWVNAAAASPLQARTTATGTTSSIANNASVNLDIAGFKTYSLLAIQTDKAAWVRIYANGALRTADASRPETEDPLPDAGVIAEVITTGAQTVVIAPGTIGFNFESTPTTTIPCRVTNKSGSTGTVAVTLTVLQLEA